MTTYIKTFKRKIAGNILAVAIAFGMLGCDLGTHEHTFATTWTYDESSHWHEATCEHTIEQGNIGSHQFDDWNEGKRFCLVCGYEQVCEHQYVFCM